MMDAQIMLSNNMNVIMVYKIVIGDNGPCDGVLNGHNALVRSTYHQIVDNSIKRAALEQLNVISKKIDGNLMVVRSFYSLYGDF